MSIEAIRACTGIGSSSGGRDPLEGRGRYLQMHALRKLLLEGDDEITLVSASCLSHMQGPVECYRGDRIFLTTPV